MTGTGRPLLTRLALCAYPRSFRQEYGAEVARCIDDLRCHRGLGTRRLVLRLAGDVVRSAPKMRWESLMSKPRLQPVVVVAALVAGIVVAGTVWSPMVLLPIGVLALAAAIGVVLVRAGDGPIVPDRGIVGHWYGWVLGGVASFAAGFGILAVDGPELSEPGWLACMLAWVGGLVLVAFGLVLAVVRLVNRPA